MANVTYTAQHGDTLWKIAQTYNTTVAELVRLNNIPDENYIREGQVIIISGDPVQSNGYSNVAVVTNFGLQTLSDRELYATWDWDRENTDHYEVVWKYATGVGIGFYGREENVNHHQDLYTGPENATHVTFKVRPVAKKLKNSKGKEYIPWTADWSEEKRYYYKDAPTPPATPAVPKVTIDGYDLTAELDNIDLDDAWDIVFHVVKNNIDPVAKTSVPVVMNYASLKIRIEKGSVYKVRCRATRGSNLVSEWSDYSANVQTEPSPSKGIKELRLIGSNKEDESLYDVYLDWSKVESAEQYEIQYTTRKSNFDSSTDTPKSHTINAPLSHAEIRGLSGGTTWYFRVRAKNSIGDSEWTDIMSIVVGDKPNPPTTWSSTTTAMVGDTVKLYWMHNSEDGSNMTSSILLIKVNGTTSAEYTLSGYTSADNKNLYEYELNTSAYPAGAKIEWYVRTKGIIDEYSWFSTARTIDVYAPPTASMAINSEISSSNIVDDIKELNAYPLKLCIKSGPTTQHPTGYYLRISAAESYDTVDHFGNERHISKGEEVYSRHFDESSYALYVDLTPADVDLSNNITYDIMCIVSMDSGLTAVASRTIDVSWDWDQHRVPNAEIQYDPDTYTTIIRPYCTNAEGELRSDTSMTVYRREFDGGFTEIASGLYGVTCVLDPHPSLDYARYRIVATVDKTGVITYFDVPGYPIGESSIILQWDETWSTYDADGLSESVDPPWTGSLLKLPYNIDVSDNTDPDVELVKYIGQKHPTSYYGTHVGHTATWNVEIEATDKDTLYGLRRLSAWMGDVYVREPSGSGYWANVKVGFNQKHCALTIPVTLTITRVKGSRITQPTGSGVLFLKEISFGNGISFPVGGD